MASFSKSGCSLVSQRWIFAVLASIGLCMQNVFVVIMPITILEMVVRTVSLDQQDNNSCPDTTNDTATNQTFFTSQTEAGASIERYPWDEYTQGIILSSFAWSSTIVAFFYGSLAERFGGKYIFGFGVLGQAALTFITPFVVNWGGYNALIIIRVLMGLGSDGMFPVASKMIPHWSTPADRTKIGNTVFGGSVPGMFLGTIMPALIITYSGMGWPAVFYFIGIIGMLWFPLWQIFVYETPEEHPFISEKEFEYLKSDSTVGEVNKCKLPPAPWNDIFSCKAFWAFLFAYTGTNVTYYVMLSGLPRYMGNVVKFSIENNGYFSSMPYIFMWFNSMISTWISDQITDSKWMTVTNVRKLLVTVSVTGPGIFLILASYAGCDKTLVVMMFLIGITLTGTTYPSLIINPMDLSPNYSGSLMSIGSGTAAVVAMLMPYLIGVLASHSTLEEWRIVFWIALLSAVASNIVYVFWFKAEVQPWNEPEFVNRNKTVSIKENEAVELKLMS